MYGVKPGKSANKNKNSSYDFFEGRDSTATNHKFHGNDGFPQPTLSKDDIFFYLNIQHGTLEKNSRAFRDDFFSNFSFTDIVNVEN